MASQRGPYTETLADAYAHEGPFPAHASALAPSTSAAMTPEVVTVALTTTVPDGGDGGDDGEDARPTPRRVWLRLSRVPSALARYTAAITPSCTTTTTSAEHRTRNDEKTSDDVSSGESGSADLPHDLPDDTTSACDADTPRNSSRCTDPHGDNTALEAAAEHDAPAENAHEAVPVETPGDRAGRCTAGPPRANARGHQAGAYSQHCAHPDHSLPNLSAPNHGPASPASIAQHCKQQNRVHIRITSLPPFRPFSTRLKDLLTDMAVATLATVSTHTLITPAFGHSDPLSCAPNSTQAASESDKVVGSGSISLRNDTSIFDRKHGRREPQGPRPLPVPPRAQLQAKRSSEPPFGSLQSSPAVNKSCVEGVAQTGDGGFSAHHLESQAGAAGSTSNKPRVLGERPEQVRPEDQDEAGSDEEGEERYEFALSQPYQDSDDQGFDSDSDIEEKCTQEEQDELLDGPPSALPVDTPFEAHTPLHVSTFPPSPFVESPLWSPTQSDRDSGSPQYIFPVPSPSPSAAKRYSSSDPGHTTYTTFEDTRAALPARARTMPGYTTAHMAHRAPRLQPQSPSHRQPHFPTMESILDAEIGPSGNAYTQAPAMLRPPMFYGADMNGVASTSVLPGGIEFPRRSVSQTLRPGWYGDKNSTTVSLALSTNTTTSGKRRQNKLRKLPPDSPLRKQGRRSSAPIIQAPWSRDDGDVQMGVSSSGNDKGKGKEQHFVERTTSYVLPSGEAFPRELTERVRVLRTIGGGVGAVDRERPLSDAACDYEGLYGEFDRESRFPAPQSRAGGGRDRVRDGGRPRRASVTFDEPSISPRSMSEDGHVFRPSLHPGPSATSRPSVQPNNHFSLPRSLLSATTAHSLFPGNKNPARLARRTTGSSTATAGATPNMASPGSSTTTSRSGSKSSSMSNSAASTAPTSPGLSDDGQAEAFIKKEEAEAKNYFLSEGEAEETRGNGAMSSRSSLGVQGKPKKLVKKRPMSLGSLPAPVLPESKGRASVQVDGTPATASTSGTRSRSVLGLRSATTSGTNKSSKRSGAFSDDSGASEPGEARILPPIRPPSPFWTGCSSLFHPYSRSPAQDSHATPEPAARSQVTTTDALASLAFTGDTTLSSSALAALTSRLSLQSNKDAVVDLGTPPMQERAESYDPYVEHDHTRKEARADDTDARHHKRHGTWSATMFARKAKELSSFSSSSNLRAIEARHRQQANSESVPVSDVSPSPEPSPIQSRPPLPRRRTKTLSLTQRRSMSLKRWTLAMADVPDEVLVQELERIRLEGRGRRWRAASSHGHGQGTVEGEGDEKAFVYGGPACSSADHSGSSGSHDRDHDDDVDSVVSDSFDSHSPEHEFGNAPNPREDAEWKSARRALLCCRELVRTERNYQARLRQLLAGDDTSSPSALVLTYVPALLQASEALLSRLEDDPSAWGVSVAFVAVEEELETALVAWCGVVGDLFVGDEAADGADRETTVRRLSNRFRHSEDTGSRLRKRNRSGASEVRMDSLYRKRTMSYAEGDSQHEDSQALGMFTAALGTGLAFGIAPHTPTATENEDAITLKTSRSRHASASGPLLSRRLSSWRPVSLLSSSGSLVQSAPSSPTFRHGSVSYPTKEKKFTVRELAIQPTQRVMRYVLQYRDLLQNTPTESPSRGLVERALEIATRIAGKCDRAQGNSAFIRRA